MGRIADALRKAQLERTGKLRAGEGDEQQGAVAILLDPLASHVESRRTERRNAELLTGAIEMGYRSARPSRESPVVPDPFSPRSVCWDVSQGLVAATEPDSAVTGQFRAVRTWLLSRQGGRENVCLAITSSVPREGKSLTVANLAVVLAEARHADVLAVDADLQDGSLAKLFKIPGAPGLSDILAGTATLDDSIVSTPAGNLGILPAGTRPGVDSTELLNSPAATRLFDEIRDRYRYVLVDTPAVQGNCDVGVVGALCSGVVMVVRMHHTPAELVRQSVHWLQANNLTVLGCIAGGCRTDAERTSFSDDNRDGD